MLAQANRAQSVLGLTICECVVYLISEWALGRIRSKGAGRGAERASEQRLPPAVELEIEMAVEGLAEMVLRSRTRPRG